MDGTNFPSDSLAGESLATLQKYLIVYFKINYYLVLFISNLIKEEKWFKSSFKDKGRSR